MLVAKAGQETCSVYTILKLTSALSSPLVLGLFAILPAAVALAGEPPADDAASIERGSQLFQLYCTECHGRDGRAQMERVRCSQTVVGPEERRAIVGRPAEWNELDHRQGEEAVVRGEQRRIVLAQGSHPALETGQFAHAGDDLLSAGRNQRSRRR